MSKTRGVVVSQREKVSRRCVGCFFHTESGGCLEFTARGGDGRKYDRGIQETFR